MAHVLVVKLGALGDVVMATPLIEAIIRHHAGDRVTLLTTPAYAELFRGWPALEVYAAPRRGVRHMLATLRWLRRRRFARLYDLQGSDRSALLCALSGVAERIGNHPRWPYTHHPAAPWRGQSHIFERLVEVLAAGGVSVARALPVLPADAATRAAVAAWLTRHDLTGRAFALLHAGASAARPAKRWPHFAALAQRLRDAGLTLVWLGAEPDRALNAALAGAGDVDATAAFDILALAELGRHARFAVTNDSGPMHVLAAAGIPVFGLFGPSDWRRNHALGQRAHVIACTEPASGGADSRLDALGADQVWARLAAAGVVAP